VRDSEGLQNIGKQPKRPLHATRLNAEQQEVILRHDLHGRSLREIAELVPCHVRTVKRVVSKHYAAIALEHNIEAERERAVALHREVQRVAWLSSGTLIKREKSPAALLDSIEKAQQRIEHLLCLGPASDDPVALLAEFKQVIVSLVLTEAPELATRLAERLTTRAAEAS
jgi:Sigma-70, region 4